jgi:SAM-dependent methyltransferase
MKTWSLKGVSVLLAMLATGSCVSRASEPGATSDRGRHVPDVVYVPTPNEVVDMMLLLARVSERDLVYDLGCGDGRIVVAAAKKHGCKAAGYDIDPQRVRESRANVRKDRVGHLVAIEEKDVFTLDLSSANVVTLYLLPELNVRLIPQLEKLKPGSRIVSHDFDMKGVRPDAVLTMWIGDGRAAPHKVYLWTTPLKKEPTDREDDGIYDEWEDVETTQDVGAEEQLVDVEDAR